MAINVDISKITGINQVGNSYQRKSAVPLDYYSLFNTKAEAETYAASNPVSYVGQVISYIDEGKVKVCVIENAAGSLKEVGTAPIGDGKTIEVSAEGAVALLGAATAANGTLPMLEEVEIDGEKVSKLVWKTLEDIGAGDGNDNTTYEFAFADQKITITPKHNGVAQTAQVLDLSGFITAEELQEAIAALPTDKDTTYTLSQEGMAITLTPSEGEAQTVTVDAYSKKEIDDKFDALPEDKDTTYSVAEGEKVLKLEGTAFSTVLKLDYSDTKIKLLGKNDELVSEIDASAFVADGVLNDVDYDAENDKLIFTWNIIEGTNEDGSYKYKTVEVDVKDLVDTYAAGNGLDLTGNAFSVKLAEGNESFLSVDANGVKLSGVQTAINSAQEAAESKAAELANAAKAAAIEDAKKYESKADASAVYTKSEADNLLNAKADATSVYTKTEADNLLSAKANVADVYAKGETYTKSEIDDLLEGIQGGASESAASVNTKLEAYKKVVNTEVWGNEEGTGDSRIDTIETKVNGIAAGAQVNVIEEVKVADTTESRLSISTTGKVVTVDDSGLRTDIANAKKAGTDAAQTASEAVAAASANAQAIQKNTGDITNLQTAVGTNATNIGLLQAHDTEHTAQYNALNSTVSEHGTKIATLETGKADKSAVEAAAAKASANEQAIKTLNETTIPGINGEIAKKADASALESYYTKSEVDGIKSGLEQAITDSEYDDEEVRGLISSNATAIENITKDGGTIDTKVNALAEGAVAANTKAIDDLTKGAVADNTAAIAALKADENTAGSIAAMIKAEADRAKGVEADHESRIAEVETFFEAIEAPDETIDTLAEIISYIESDKSGAS